MIDGEVTRGEFALLCQMVAELRRDLGKRFDDHERVHEQERRDRAAARHWQIGTVIAVLVLLVSILGLVISLHPAR